MNFNLQCHYVFRPQPKSWGPIELGCPSVRPSVCLSVCLSVRQEVGKFAKIAQNSGFLRLELVRARTFERKVIEIWL